jgi:hypothetical protein
MSSTLEGAMPRDAKPLTALVAPLTPRKSEVRPAAGCVPVNCGGRVQHEERGLFIPGTIKADCSEASLCSPNQPNQAYQTCKKPYSKPSLVSGRRQAANRASCRCRTCFAMSSWTLRRKHRRGTFAKGSPTLMKSYCRCSLGDRHAARHAHYSL